MEDPYALTGFGQGLAGIAEGLKLGYTVQDKKQERANERAKVLADSKKAGDLASYRSEYLADRTLQSEANRESREWIAEQNRLTREEIARLRDEQKSASAKDPILEDFKAVASAHGFTGPLAPIALNMARELKRMPTMEEVMAKMPQQAGGTDSPGFHPLNAIRDWWHGGPQGAAQPGAPVMPAPTAPPPRTGTYDWRSKDR